MPYMTSIQFLVSAPASYLPSVAASSPTPRYLRRQAVPSNTPPGRKHLPGHGLLCCRRVHTSPLSPLPCSPVSERGESPIAENCLHASVRILQDCRLSLIHIPLHLYPYFVQRILSVVLPESSPTKENSVVDTNNETNSTYHPTPEPTVTSDFVNISVTPVECSVVCSKQAADKLFTPLLKSLDAEAQNQIVISDDDFVAVQVDGEGLDAGQRVLDLTSPLALAGM